MMEHPTLSKHAGQSLEDLDTYSVHLHNSIHTVVQYHDGKEFLPKVLDPMEIGLCDNGEAMAIVKRGQSPHFAVSIQLHK